MINLKGLLTIKSEENYPLVYIPSNLSSFILENNIYELNDEIIIKEFSLTPPKEPYCPRQPSLPVDYKYVKYEKIKLRIHYKLMLYPGIFVLFLFVGTIQQPTPPMVAISLFVFVLIIIIIIWRIRIIDDYKKVLLSKYEKEKKQNEYLISVDKYKNDLEIYNKLKKEYSNNKIMFKKEVERYKSVYVLNKYYEKLKMTINPIRCHNNIVKGKTEDYFLNILTKYFSTEIKIDMKLITFNSAFYPDYVYESKKYGFYIDIEIDERYDFHTKKPIHYIGSEDEERNKYFLDRNWFVIRFAEEQILNHSNECCLFIKQVIDIIINPDLFNAYSSFNNMQKIKRWTYEEAYLDGKNNVRK
jgi:hypothetical protein